MSKIMFKGREVVEEKEHEEYSCRDCVFDGMLANSCPRTVRSCFDKNTIYVYAKPPLDVFIDRAAKNYFFFFGKLHNVDFSSGRYSSRRVAIRGAKRFCAKIGFECRIKGDK